MATTGRRNQPLFAFASQGLISGLSDLSVNDREGRMGTSNR